MYKVKDLVFVFIYGDIWVMGQVKELYGQGYD